jgi:simple sugar transport system substrate-binding protein
MKKLISIFFAIIATSFIFSTAAKADGHEPYKFNFVMHSDTNNAFWAAVHKGFKDACAQVGADCQMLTLSGDGDQQEQLQNLESSIAQGVDGIVTTITNPTIFDGAVDEALAAGIPVITANTDDPEGAAGSNRLAYIGQDLEKAGYELASALSKQFPDGDVHVLIGVADMNQSWAYTRANGIARFMEDYKAANTDRNVTYEKIESGMDLSTVGNRVAAYVQTNPNTTAYFDVGFWEAGAAQGIRNLGYEPGQMLLAGFDLVDVVFEEMEKGYVQLTVDQQPYYQGYMAVHQLYLMNKYGLSALDIDTGKAMIGPEDVAQIRSFKGMSVR